MSDTAKTHISFSNNAMLRRLPDIICLLEYAYISNILMGNPVYGLGAGLLVTLVFNYIRLSIAGGSLLYGRAARLSVFLLLLATVACNVMIFIVYPGSALRSECAVLFMLAMLTLLKRVLALWAASRELSRMRRTVTLAAIHLVFCAAFCTACCFFMPTYALLFPVIGYISSDTVMLLGEITHPSPRRLEPNVLAQTGSYRLFSMMSLFCGISFYLAAFAFIGLTVAGVSAKDSAQPYSMLLLWLWLTGGATLIFYRLLRVLPRNAGIGLFIFGAVCWIFACFRLYTALGNTVRILLMSLLFALGLAAMYSALYRINENFKQVSCVIDEDISLDRLMQSTDLVQSAAFNIAALLLLLWLMVSPRLFSQPEQMRISGLGAMLAPLIFIILSIIQALRQPLDGAGLDKLHRLEKGNGGTEMKKYLSDILVKKYRRRYGVRIIAFFLKPLLYHKVYGRENVDNDDLPAVFVCNHGEIYGPVTAVTQLPYYFRPWVQAKMLDYRQAKEHILKGTFEKMHLPGFIAKFLSCICARCAVWALNSFDPVPVYLGNLKEVLKTMQDSVKVLSQGDSLLLFPENPNAEENGRYALSGAPAAFYTGFAQIGIEAYKRCGKCVTFYPVFVSKHERTLHIGKGVRYDEKANRHEEKQRIASALQDAMEQLSQRGSENPNMKKPS